MYRNSSFSKALDIAINLETPKFYLLTTGKVITYVSTSSFMYVFRSPGLLSKLDEPLLRGRRNCTLGKEGLLCVTVSFNRLGGYRVSEIIQGIFEGVSNLK